MGGRATGRAGRTVVDVVVVPGVVDVVVEPGTVDVVVVPGVVDVVVPGIVVVVVLSGDPEAPTGPEKATASVAQVTSAPSAGPRRGGVPRGGVAGPRRSRRRAVRPTQPGTGGTKGNVARAERPARRMTFEMWKPRRRQHSGCAAHRRPDEHGLAQGHTTRCALAPRLADHSAGHEVAG